MIEEDRDKSPLRLLREQNQLTQYQLRQLIGVSERRLSDWENGKALCQTWKMLWRWRVFIRFR
ncbi:MAG TPA: hypothetical protein DDW76_02235 [Cyanobacteria bacterium UBA11369]|nr:hypothetical protein [Cyanobacteria bacterium UBA11371]HBE29844.1 hypothetical protein [Cyanobacteria bacterium UBA11368]HBE47648.1 hypothetical protein [Cyanobacteria bacterium UBA11369]